MISQYEGVYTEMNQHKKVAVIGKGLAGLSSAFYLSSSFHVDLFYAAKEGASAAATGLLHPYPGAHGRKTLFADEAMIASKELLSLAEKKKSGLAFSDGLYKRGEIEEKKRGVDVEEISSGYFWIKSGITVQVPLYLEALQSLCKERPVSFYQQEIQEISALEGYEAIVVAAGAGIFSLLKGKLPFKLSSVKGQMVVSEIDTPQSISLLLKEHHLLKTSDERTIYVGSTYERGAVSDEPDVEKAIQELRPPGKVLECRAGIRVTNPKGYFPIIQNIYENVWVFTALGSRGLLYHAFLGKQLADKIRAQAK